MKLDGYKEIFQEIKTEEKKNLCYTIVMFVIQYHGKKRRGILYKLLVGKYMGNEIIFLV